MQEIERQAKRQRTLEEREERERQRQEAKQKKEQDRDEQKSSKELARLKTLDAKLMKDKSKKDDKVSIQMRREVTNELRKARNAAGVSVLHYFDTEQELLEREIASSQLSLSTSKSAASASVAKDGNEKSFDNESKADEWGELGTFPEVPDAEQPSNSDNNTRVTLSLPALIKSLENCAVINNLDSATWDKLLEISNCVYTFRSLLNLQSVLDVEALVAHIRVMSSSSSSSAATVRATDRIGNLTLVDKVKNALSDGVVSRGADQGVSECKREGEVGVIGPVGDGDTRGDGGVSALARDDGRGDQVMDVEVPLADNATVENVNVTDQNPSSIPMDMASEKELAPRRALEGQPIQLWMEGLKQRLPPDLLLTSAAGVPLTLNSSAFAAAERPSQLPSLLQSATGTSQVATGTGTGTGMEESEEEWDERQASASMAPRGRKRGDASGDFIASSSISREMNESEAALDRVHLCITRAVSGELHSLLGLIDEKDGGAGEAQKKDRRGCNVPLPLNQMTWPEIARMCFLLRVFQETERPDEEALHAIRGSKQLNFRTPRNVVRYIRYKWAVVERAARSLVSTGVRRGIGGGESGGGNPMNTVDRGVSPTLGQVVDDDCLIALARVAAVDGTESIGPQSQPAIERGPDRTVDEYDSRSLRVMSTSGTGADKESKGNIDLEVLVEPEIVDTSMFSTEDDISNALIQLADDVGVDETRRRCCKVLIRLLGLNCAKMFIWDVARESYPEYYEMIKSPISLSQIAAKLISGGYYGVGSPGRFGGGVVHVDVIGSGRFPVSVAAFEFYEDVRQVAINCVTFNTEMSSIVMQAHRLAQALYRHFLRWVIASPKSESGENSTGLNSSLPDISLCDEHHCLLSHTALSPNVSGSTVKIDDYGFSCISPWMLNTKYSRHVEKFETVTPAIRRYLEAFAILSSPGLSPFLTTRPPGSSGGSRVRSWNVQERVTVIHGLCELLKTNPKSQDFLQQVCDECSAIMDMATSDSFREADFVEKVRVIAGDQGVAACRSLLDGVEEADADTLNRVIDGRCIVCKCSTYEEDGDVADGGKEGGGGGNGNTTAVVLCDGCNAEAHLACLGLTKVPSAEWYCPSCTDRLNTRMKSKGGAVEGSFGDLRQYRHVDLESALIERVKDARVAGDTLTTSDGELCEYCGMTELELCSPLVVGQSRAEFEQHVHQTKTIVIHNYYSHLEGKDKDVTVSFALESRLHPTPQLKIPHFPILGEPLTQVLLKYGRESDSISVCPIVHQLCALTISEARLDQTK
eukprot:gene235-242_t